MIYILVLHQENVKYLTKTGNLMIFLLIKIDFYLSIKTEYFQFWSTKVGILFVCTDDCKFGYEIKEFN